MSYEQRRLLELIAEDRSMVFKPDVVQPAHSCEAARLLPAYQDICSVKVSSVPNRVAHWLKELNRGLAFPLAQPVVGNVHVAVMRGSGDLPGCVFNEETLAMATRGVKNLSAYAVDQVVRPVGLILLTKMAVLQAIAARGEGRDGQKPFLKPGHAEREAISAKLWRDMGRSRPPAATIELRRASVLPIKPAPLTDSELLAKYEQLAQVPHPGQALAATRAAGLRAKLAKVADETKPDLPVLR